MANSSELGLLMKKIKEVLPEQPDSKAPGGADLAFVLGEVAKLCENVQQSGDDAQIFQIIYHVIAHGDANSIWTLAMTIGQSYPDSYSFINWAVNSGRASAVHALLQHDFLSVSPAALLEILAWGSVGMIGTLAARADFGPTVCANALRIGMFGSPHAVAACVAVPTVDLFEVWRGAIFGDKKGNAELAESAYRARTAAALTGWVYAEPAFDGIVPSPHGFAEKVPGTESLSLPGLGF